MNYWLIKSEPGTFSWDDMKSAGVEPWNGVRNYQARNFIKEMRVGDLCIFYHSTNERRIMGVVKVVKEAYPDPTDETGKFCMMDVKYEREIENKLTLEEIKKNPKLAGLMITTHSRLSVMPVSKDHWKILVG